MGSRLTGPAPGLDNRIISDLACFRGKVWEELGPVEQQIGRMRAFERLAERSGLAVDRLFNVVNAGGPEPTLSEISRIAHALGFYIGDLFPQKPSR